MDKISWTDRVGNEEVLQRVKEERSILHRIKRRKIDCIGHILRRDWLLKRVIEVKIEERVEETVRLGRRSKQLMCDFKERGRYWRRKKEELDRTLWRTRFGSDCGTVARQAT